MDGHAVVEFSDGSVYKWGPISEADWLREYRDAEQPGCAWNYGPKDRPPTRWEKLGGFPAGLLYVFEHDLDGGYRAVS